MRRGGRYHVLRRLWDDLHGVADGGGWLVDGRRLRDILWNGRVAPLMGMRFPARVLVFIAGVGEPLMADEEVASSKGLCANVANERFLFGMGADVSLEMFLCACRS